MTQQVQQHVADAAAAISTASVAAYTFTDFLEQTALIVAIVSGSFAIAWHVYQFVKEHRKHKQGNKQ